MIFNTLTSWDASQRACVSGISMQSAYNPRVLSTRLTLLPNLLWDAHHALHDAKAMQILPFQSFIRL